MENFSPDTNDSIEQDTERMLSLIERSESIKSKPELSNGRGRLFVQNSKPSRNAPALKGSIILDNKHYLLSGWICISKSKKSKYISLLVSERETELDGSGTYKLLGKGFLRFSKQTAPKQPSYRGEIEIISKVFSLSAWRTSCRGRQMLNINSHPIETSSYSEIQKELEEWDKGIIQ